MQEALGRVHQHGVDGGRSHDLRLLDNIGIDAGDLACGIHVAIAEIGARGEDFLIAQAGEIGRGGHLCGSIAMARKDIHTQERLRLGEREQEGEQDSVYGEHVCG